METKQREKLNLTKSEARDLISNDLEGFEIIKEEIYQQRRWETDYEVIVKRVSDNKFFRGCFSKGSTEQQDSQPFEYDEPDFEEVFPVEKKVIAYE